ncbi:hypothetical protein K523DRAFT_261551 [Schizophyllum commune Tattone D]|nr:hypothetical protein K525DRAFT_226945 [Schizophyllum commune Loenen D]KAI5835111.1 hypothetical protein K523DRAFT_261551 [Schizophyllum commune Tattone D]
MFTYPFSTKQACGQTKSGGDRPAQEPDEANRMEHGDLQYGHMQSMHERRSSSASTYAAHAAHPGLGQALASHLAPPPYPRPDAYARITSPAQPPAPQPPSPHHQVSFAAHTSPALKRKQPEQALLTHAPPKRRRDTTDDTPETYDPDGGGQGAKHWTDDEKTKLFTWLMGVNQDDHWSSLRATKNSCLRDCASEVFDNKKTYQALKGCYERNFNIFRQIYAFETYCSQNGLADLSAYGETDRIREYERRLQNAKRAGCDVGNINARTIDHWRRMGWYDLFYRRWNGDPAMTRPITTRNSGGGSASIAPEQPDDDGPDYQEQTTANPTISFINMGPPPSAAPPSSMPPPSQPHYSSHQVSSSTPQYSHTPVSAPAQPPPQPQAQPQPPVPPPVPAPAPAPAPVQPTLSFSAQHASSSQPQSESGAVNVTLTQPMLTAYLQFLQTQTQHLQMQTQTNKLKLDYLRRKEEREERESRERYEVERMRLEREERELEHSKQVAAVKQKSDRAIDLLGNPAVDPSIKQVAGDYLKKLFME